MQKYFVSLLLLVGCISLAQAQNIQEGTYVGNGGKRINIGSYTVQDTQQYDLILVNLVNPDSVYRLSTVSGSPLQLGKSYIFSAQPNPYYDDLPISDCQISAIWNDSGSVSLTGNNCDTEKSLLGQFVFSKQATFIPKKFHGRWGSDKFCLGSEMLVNDNIISFYVDKSSPMLVNADYFDDGLVSFELIDIIEGIGSYSRVNLNLKNNILHVQDDRNEPDSNRKLIKCIN